MGYSRCSYGCIYCFSEICRFDANGHGAYHTNHLGALSISAIKSLVRGKSSFSKFLTHNNGLPAMLQYGALSDQFDEYERRYGRTYKILKILSKYRIPISFSTKSVWWFQDNRYRELFIKNKDIWHVKVSIITTNDELASRIELGCPSSTSRLALIKDLAINEIYTTLRMRPYIINVTDEANLIKASALAGAKSVSTEFLCIPVSYKNSAFNNNHFIKLNEAIGWDILQYYNDNHLGSGSVEMRLNRQLKTPINDNIMRLCKQYGLEYYSSDRHFKHLCDNVCCCGPNHNQNKYTFNEYNYSKLLKRSLNNNINVYFHDIFPKNAEVLNIQIYNLRHCNLKLIDPGKYWWGKLTLREIFRERWNDLNNYYNPCKYYWPLLKPVDVDNNGNIVYQANNLLKKG